MRSVQLISSVLFALAFVAGAWAQDAPADPPVNQMCPVMTDEPVDPDITLEFEGQTIGFCCRMCVVKFKANPDKYRANLAKVLQGPAGDSPANSPDSPKTERAPNTERPPLPARLHPVIVHFPVAGIPLALLGLLIWLGGRKPSFAAADFPPLVASMLAAIAAVITGDMAHDAGTFAPSLHEYVEWHERAGFTVLGLTILLTLLRAWRWKRLSGIWLGIYTGGLIAAAGLVGAAGYLGGSLVYGPDHLSW